MWMAGHADRVKHTEEVGLSTVLGDDVKKMEDSEFGSDDELNCRAAVR